MNPPCEVCEERLALDALDVTVEVHDNGSKVAEIDLDVCGSCFDVADRDRVKGAMLAAFTEPEARQGAAA